VLPDHSEKGPYSKTEPITAAGAIRAVSLVELKDVVGLGEATARENRQG
jgi:hypothetical protein